LCRTSELVKDLISNRGAFDPEYVAQMERGVECLNLMSRMPDSPKLFDCLVVMHGFDACCLAARHPALSDSDRMSVVKSLDLISHIYPCLVALLTLPPWDVISPSGEDDLTVKRIYDRLLSSRRGNDLYFNIKMADAVTLLSYLAKSDPCGESLRLVEELWVHTVSYRDALHAVKAQRTDKSVADGRAS